MVETRDCPDCEQGKHLGCLVEVLDENDEWVTCPCAERNHDMPNPKLSEDPEFIKFIDVLEKRILEKPITDQQRKILEDWYPEKEIRRSDVV